MKRSISLILVLAMLATAMLGITSFAEEEASVATASDALPVCSARVEFGNTVYLHVAVKADSADGLKLTITNTVLDDDDPDKTVTLDPDTSIDAPDGCIAFRYGKLGAKNMGDKLSLQASQGDVVGKAKTYSILEYALTAENENNAELTALVKAMIKYGAKAQVAFGHTGTYALDKSYGLVSAARSNEGKYIEEIGTTVSFTADTAKTGDNAVLYDASLTKANSTMTVSKAYKKLVYIGDSQITALNLNTDDSSFAATGDLKYIDNTSGTSNVATASTYIYTSVACAGSKTDLGGTRNKIGLTTGAVSAGQTAGFRVVTKDDGRKAIEWHISQTSAVKTSAIVSGKFATDAVYTVSFSMGTTDTFLFSGFRLRGKTNGSYFWSVAKSGDGWNIRAQDGTVLMHVGKNTDFTLHVVFDFGAKTQTYYNEDGGAIYMQAISSNNYNNATDGQASPYFDWTCYKSSGFAYSKSYLYKLVGYNGNIFE